MKTGSKPLLAVAAVCLVTLLAGCSPRLLPFGGDSHAPVWFGGLDRAPGAPSPDPHAEITSDADLTALVGRATPGRPLDLPPRPDGVRRLAFVLTGCAHDSARLTVGGDGTVGVRLVRDDPDIEIDCAQAMYYLAVFDVPADRLAANPFRATGGSPTP